MNKILAFCILIIFFSYVIYGSFKRKDDLKELEAKGKLTSAEIINCDNNGIKGSSPFLVLEFYVGGKRFKKIRHNLGLDNYCKFVGEKVWVTYLPSDPSVCKFNLEKLK